MNQYRYHDLYLDLANRIAKMSRAIRFKIGCVIVSNEQLGNIISFGWNDMPPGFDNRCEYIIETGELIDYEHFIEQNELDITDIKSRPEIVHAEENAINKACFETGKSYSFYVTHLPCLRCAQNIVNLKQMVDVEVFYRYDYISNSTSRTHVPSSEIHDLFKSNGINIKRIP